VESIAIPFVARLDRIRGMHAVSHKVRPPAAGTRPAGFTTLDPTNAKSTVATSVVYAAPGFEADAIAVAGLLGLPPTVVKPLTVPPPAEVGDPADAAVVAVLGPDSAAAGATTSSAPAAN